MQTAEQILKASEARIEQVIRANRMAVLATTPRARNRWLAAVRQISLGEQAA